MSDWEQRIVDAWQANAEPWTEVINNKRIASREQLSNQAIIDAILECQPRDILDIGCGEGWLCRALAAQRIECWGCDAAAELIRTARLQSPTTIKVDYSVVSYDKLTRAYRDQQFDLCVCNFSLLGKESTEQVLAACRVLLRPGGCLIIQTLAPQKACGQQDYCDGWREGSWAGLDQGIKSQFNISPPWYFRTLPSWLALFQRSGYQLTYSREPKHADIQLSTSIIFCLQC